MLLLISGLPGSGKSTLARAFAAKSGALHLNSDLVRRDLVLMGSYRIEDKEKVYATLLKRTLDALAEGQDVIVDSTFYKAAIRKPFFQMAADYDIPLHWIEVCAAESTIRERLKTPRPDSEADFGVYQKIRAEADPFLEAHLVLFSDAMSLEKMVESIELIVHAMPTPVTKLLKKITILLQNMAVNYPDLHLNVDEEKPAFDPDNAGKLTERELTEYYDFLKIRLKDFIENHQLPVVDL